MKKLFLYSTIAFLTAATATTGFAKDDKKKDKDKDDNNDKDRVVHVERDGRRYYVDRDGKRHWVESNDRDYDRRRDNRNDRNDRTRSIYVIERGRPVERVVFMDASGRYYRMVDGRRLYVQERYYDSYPTKYYYPDGRRRVTISLPF
jgi:hypothetical protein